MNDASATPEPPFITSLRSSTAVIELNGSNQPGNLAERLAQQARYVRASTVALNEVRDFLSGMSGPAALGAICLIDETLELAPDESSLAKTEDRVKLLTHLLDSAKDVIEDLLANATQIAERLGIDYGIHQERHKATIVAVDDLISAVTKARSDLNNYGADTKYLEKALEYQHPSDSSE